MIGYFHKPPPYFPNRKPLSTISEISAAASSWLKAKPTKRFLPGLPSHFLRGLLKFYAHGPDLQRSQFIDDQ